VFAHVRRAPPNNVRQCSLFAKMFAGRLRHFYGSVMGRAPSTFRQQDVTRAVKAVAAAGVHISRVEIDKTGKITIIAATPAEAGQQDDLDLELQDWEARYGQG
jgi:hypothetical protein